METTARNYGHCEKCGTWLSLRPDHTKCQSCEPPAREVLLFSTFRSSSDPEIFLPIDNRFKDSATGLLALGCFSDTWMGCVEKNDFAAGFPIRWTPLPDSWRVEVHPLGRSEGVYLFRPAA